MSFIQTIQLTLESNKPIETADLAELGIEVIESTKSFLRAKRNDVKFNGYLTLTEGVGNVNWKPSGETDIKS
jgi:hypothetical protein